MSIADRDMPRALAGTLAAAEADRLAQVVAVVDALSQRGAADDILAPLRPRLARLRPPRPLRFARLLFLPLGAVIVPPVAWRRGSPAIPRNAIEPIARLLQATLPEAAEVATIIAGHSTADHAIIEQAGAMLWTAAGARLASASETPEGWSRATGLQPADFATLAGQVAAGLAVATSPPGQGAVGQALTASAPGGGIAAATAMIVLLVRGTAAEIILREAASRALHAAFDDATDFLIARLGAGAGLAEDLAEAELAVRRAARIIATAARPGQPANRTARLHDALARLDHDARTRFDGALDTRILLPMATPGPLPDDVVATIEAMARDLRRFAATARAIGSAAHYDQALRHLAATLRPAPTDSPALRTDKLRLVEIIAGSETAAAMNQTASA